MTAADALRRFAANEPARSVAHDVWLSPSYAVKVSDGRLRETLRHERDVLAALPESVPHPMVVEYGAEGPTEWLAMTRVPGTRLADAWGALDRTERRTVAAQLAASLRDIHGTPRPMRFALPWLADALAPGGARGDAYHAPPDRYQLLIGAARALPDADQTLLDDAERYLANALSAFDGDHMVLAHTDYVPTNHLVHKGKLSAVLDLEGARPAARDVELMPLIRFTRAPQEFGADPGEDWTLLVPTLLEEYGDLAAHPRLGDRLTSYGFLWQLVQLHHRPASAYAALRELLDHPGQWPEAGVA